MDWLTREKLAGKSADRSKGGHLEHAKIVEVSVHSVVKES